jgi:hypothetical protein
MGWMWGMQYGLGTLGKSKNLISILLRDKEKGYREAQPPSKCMRMTDKMASVLDDVRDEAEWMDEYEDVAMDFSEGHREDVRENEADLGRWVKRHWGKGSKEFFKCIREPIQGTFVGRSKYKRGEGAAEVSKNGKEYKPFASYYNDLGTSKQAKGVGYWARHFSPLTAADSASLSGLFSVEELDSTVRSLVKGKSHGEDGIPGEFYQIMWEFPWFREVLLSVMNSCYEQAACPRSWRRLVVAVLYKKGDREDVKNYRPISITCVDYKIQARMLANRLAKLIPSIIGPEQVGYVHERIIFENIGIVQAVLDGKEGGVHFSDFAAAFPSVPHNFILELLTLMKFPPRFVEMMRIYHEGVRGTIKVNGGVGGDFTFGRGVKQGCPLSPLLFNIVIECFLREIRSSIKGIVIGGARIKVRAFADDCVYFTKDSEDVRVLSEIMRQWEVDSHMSFAPHKSFSIGAGRRVLDDGEQLQVRAGGFCRLGSAGAPSEAAYLGWMVGVNQFRADRISWGITFDKAEARAAYLGRFRFSFPLKVQVLKAMLVSLFTYKTYFLLPTLSEQKRFKALVCRFLWGGGHA